VVSEGIINMKKSCAIDELLRIILWLDVQKTTVKGQQEGYLDEKALKDLADRLVGLVSLVQANILKK